MQYSPKDVPSKVVPSFIQIWQYLHSCLAFHALGRLPIFPWQVDIVGVATFVMNLYDHLHAEKTIGMICNLSFLPSRHTTFTLQGGLNVPG